MLLPKNRRPTHPGQMLNEAFMKPMGMSQKQLASHLGWTPAKVNEIIHGKRGITAESALSLADAFDMEPEFWLNLQLVLDLWIAERQHQSRQKISPCFSTASLL